MPARDYAPYPPTDLAVVDSIGSAVDFFDNLTPPTGPTISFRGHADADWLLVPSIFRDDMSVLDYESRVIRDLISLYPSEFEPDRTMFDRLVRMQHFGLRTRLMDLTRDPLVALYFAVEEG